MTLLCCFLFALYHCGSGLAPLCFPLRAPIFVPSRFLVAQKIVSGADILKQLREDASNDVAPPPRSGTTRDGDGKANIWVSGWGEEGWTAGNGRTWGCWCVSDGGGCLPGAGGAGAHVRRAILERSDGVAYAYAARACQTGAAAPDGFSLQCQVLTVPIHVISWAPPRVLLCRPLPTE